MVISKEKTPLARGFNYRVRLGKKTHRYDRTDYPLYGFLKARLTAEARTSKEHKATVRLAALKLKTRAVVLISRIMTVVHPDSVLLAVNQRAKLSRLWVETASNSFHPDM